MIDINNLIRKNILALVPYSSARNEFSGTEGVFLDANENPFGSLNRYPDPYQKKLKETIGKIKKVDLGNIFLGNGSDEVIDLCFRIFCEPGKDKAVVFTPTYGMYEIAAKINNVEVMEVPLNSDFQIDTKPLKDLFNDKSVKLLFVCSPNNPTGNIIYDIEFLLKNFKAIVVVDEAYIDFSTSQSIAEKINHYPNLVIVQTLSKAWGLASIRIGMAFAHSKIIDFFNKVKPPYNVSTPNQELALTAILEVENYENNRQIILNEKAKLIELLNTLPFVNRVYPSEANFLLLEVKNANNIYNSLVSKGIVIRNRDKIVKNCVRITIGTPQENELLMHVLKQI